MDFIVNLEPIPQLPNAYLYLPRGQSRLTKTANEPATSLTPELAGMPKIPSIIGGENQPLDSHDARAEIIGRYCYLVEVVGGAASS